MLCYVMHQTVNDPDVVLFAESVRLNYSVAFYDISLIQCAMATLFRQ